MPDETDLAPAPHRPTLADLDPERAATDGLVAMARGHREGQDDPAPERPPGNLPAVLRARCDVLLAGAITALDAAYRLASIIGAVEGALDPPGAPAARH